MLPRPMGTFRLGLTGDGGRGAMAHREIALFLSGDAGFGDEANEDCTARFPRQGRLTQGELERNG